MNQPGFNGKYPIFFCGSVGSLELSPETKKAQLGLGWMDLLKHQDDETDGGCSEIIQGLTPNNSISLYGTV